MKKITTIKLLNKVLFAFVATVLVVACVVILIINYQLANERKFLFSAQGLLNYLSAYSGYKDLFVAAIAATAAYVGLQGLQETVSANREKLKQDRFSEWKNRIDIRILEVEKYDPYLRRVFMEKRAKYFDFLYSSDFFITNKEQLRLGLAVFAEAIPFLEDLNPRALSMGQIYLSADSSYSFDSFRFVFIGAADNLYPEVEADLKSFYIGLLPPNRIVNAQMYKSALNNRLPDIF